MSLSIIIPCKNEEQNIEQTIETICSYISEKIHDYQINVINDFSTDKTSNILNQIAKNNKKIKIFENEKRGLGGAINCGISNSDKKYSVIVMADLSDSPNDIVRYYNEISDKNLDAVLGSRFLKNSEVIDYPKKKLIINRIFNFITKVMFFENYNDFTNAFKIYKTEVLKEIRPIVSENFNVFLELPLKIIIRKYNYSVINIDWRNREKGDAKFKIKELGSKYLFTLLYCFFEKILLNQKRDKISNINKVNR